MKEIIIPHLYLSLRKYAAQTEERRKSKYRDYAAAYVNKLECGRYAVHDYKTNAAGQVIAICKRKGE